MEGAHQALSVLGSGLRASVTVKPSSYLEQHWMQMLGECKTIRYGHCQLEVQDLNFKKIANIGLIVSDPIFWSEATKDPTLHSNE